LWDGLDLPLLLWDWLDLPFIVQGRARMPTPQESTSCLLEVPYISVSTLLGWGKCLGSPMGLDFAVFFQLELRPILF
jgi:hypothetical protein